MKLRLRCGEGTDYFYDMFSICSTLKRKLQRIFVANIYVLTFGTGSKQTFYLGHGHKGLKSNTQTTIS